MPEYFAQVLVHGKLNAHQIRANTYIFGHQVTGKAVAPFLDYPSSRSFAWIGISLARQTLQAMSFLTPLGDPAMSNALHHPGFEESVLYSDDDYEPYGYNSPRLTSTTEATQSALWSRFGPYEREIEAAVLRKLDFYPGC